MKYIKAKIILILIIAVYILSSCAGPYKALKKDDFKANNRSEILFASFLFEENIDGEITIVHEGLNEEEIRSEIRSEINNA